MPKASVANVTASARKKPRKQNHLRNTVIGLAVLGAVFSLTAFSIGLWHIHSCTMRLSTGCYSLELAVKPGQAEKGLADRDSIPENHGMVFLTGTDKPSCMWMKGMRYNLDMIWLSSDYRINKLQSNVSPDTYPQTFCSDNTILVIELNAGQIAKNNLQLGQQLHVRPFHN